MISLSMPQRSEGHAVTPLLPDTTMSHNSAGVVMPGKIAPLPTIAIGSNMRALRLRACCSVHFHASHGGN